MFNLGLLSIPQNSQPVDPINNNKLNVISR